jgi:hypothetical protein
LLELWLRLRKWLLPLEQPVRHVPRLWLRWRLRLLRSQLLLGAQLRLCLREELWLRSPKLRLLELRLRLRSRLLPLEQPVRHVPLRWRLRLL